jgi:NADH-quinone oxidoreductase subunit L
MVVNRIGDVGLALAMFAIFQGFKTLDFATIFACAEYYAQEEIIFMHQSFHALTVIGLLLLVGAVGKSAQLGLHT